jgi:hypothetical protein
VAHPQIAVFARMADGNAETVRRIEGQQTLLGRTQHSIHHNHIRDEIVIPQPWAGAVLTFPGDANGELSPIRIIRGSNTGLALSDTMSIDPLKNEYWVPAGQGRDAMHIFDGMAEGNAAPIRIMSGSGVGAGYPSVVWEHDLLVTSDDNEVRIFDATATGDVEPLRVITGGPLSGHDGPDRARWIPGTRNFLAAVRPFGANTYGDRPGAPTNYQTPEEALTYVGVWSIDDNGDVAPRYTIAHDVLKEFRGVALNLNNKEVMIADKSGNAIFTFSFPEAWETFEPVTVP